MQGKEHQMKEIPSPNFNARLPGLSVDYIVLHYTNMRSAKDSLKHLCNPESKVSAHYLIDENGKIFRLVEEEKRAWHAGESFWRGQRNMNSASIGIELHNPGRAFGYRPFPEKQMAALKGLLREMKERWGLSPACLLGHSDIAPARKDDPGELFPWKEFAEEGFGLWPAPNAEDYAPEKEGEVGELLGRIGYDCSEDTLAALTAFKRHYHPEALEKEDKGETLARLRALAKQI